MLHNIIDDIYKWPLIKGQHGKQSETSLGGESWLKGSRRGTRWHVAHLLFSVINEGEGAGATATAAWIIRNNKTLMLTGGGESRKREGREREGKNGGNSSRSMAGHTAHLCSRTSSSLTEQTTSVSTVAFQSCPGGAARRGGGGLGSGREGQLV